MIKLPWKRDRIISLTMICFFIVGYIGHVVAFSRGLMLILTPFFLLGMGLLVLSPFIIKRNYKVLIWAMITYIITFAIEALGVYTGSIFGEYEYGATLGPGPFHVPLVIGFNWIIVIMGSTELSRILIKNRAIYPLIAGATAMVFDIIMEPVAMELDYWDWAGGTIPVQNYIAWFIIATVMAYSYTFVRKKGFSKPLVLYLMLQTILFLIVRLFVVGG